MESTEKFVLLVWSANVVLLVHGVKYFITELKSY